MKKKPNKKRAPQQCHHHNPNPSISSLFQEVFEADEQRDAEHFHEALNHSEAFNFMIEVSQEGDTSMCCLLSDAIRFGWKAGQRAQECKNLEEFVNYGKP